MIEYLIKTEIGGMEIRLIKSPYGLAVVYGMSQKSFDISEMKAALKEYKNSVNHAIECEMPPEAER